MIDRVKSFTLHSSMLLILMASLIVEACSDFSDYNTVPNPTDTTAGNTLWENIAVNTDLTDFAAVLQRVGYNEQLSASHIYTVWAPVNGTFNKDSLLEVSDAKTLKQFVYNHIANYSHLESDLEDTLVYMLNKKLLKFRNKGMPNITFDGKNILPNGNKFNIPSSNGILYAINAPTVFKYSGYEYISEMGGIADNFMNYVKKYENSYLDVNASVKGIIDENGRQTYDDSVMVVVNTLTTTQMRALLDSEDSLYTLLIPNNEAWDKEMSKISKCYNYISPMKYQNLSSDALKKNVGSTDESQIPGGTCPTTTGALATIMSADMGKEEVALSNPPSNAEIKNTAAYWNDSITKKFLVSNLAFSENDRVYNTKLSTGEAFVAGDTLRSTTKSKLTNLVRLDEVTEKKIELSNGHARIISEYPFKSWEIYNKKIKSRRVGRYITAKGLGTINYTVYNISPSICVLDKDEDTKELHYVKTEVGGGVIAPELDFYIPNVLSTTYDVYIVMVDGWVDAEDRSTYVPKPYSLRVDINYTDANNKQITGRFDPETGTVKTSDNMTELTKVKPIICCDPNDPNYTHKVDTVKLGRITFPVCYANTGAMPNIKVMHTLSAFGISDKATWTQELRVANIIFKPIDMIDDEQ